MNPVISVRNISKQYRISHYRGGYIALRDVLSNIAAHPLRFLKNKARSIIHDSSQEDFHALNDVSFEIQRGECVGIIGRNGAGKSTLLKILSRITPPTTGEIVVQGRIGSLLEVGTGFHPELTGRENIFLNGAILGMTRQEIITKFDDIVQFAGIEKFLDTPVKRYSSGMYVRLAFSVAAHMEPDILIVDEVLAVGDVEFQKKCLGKMQDVTKKEGRTVLFVSHNMGAIQGLCSKSLLLEQGKVIAFDETSKVIQKYIQDSSVSQDTSPLQMAAHKGNQCIRIHNVRILDGEGHPLQTLLSGRDAVFQLDYKTKEAEELKNVSISLSIDSSLGQRILSLSNEYAGSMATIRHKTGSITCKIPKLPLNIGTYTTTIFITVNGEIADWVKQAFTFTVEDGNYFGHGKNPEAQDGVVLTEHVWNIHPSL